MQNLEAVFWDVDGTLADTELDGHRVAFNRSFSDAGITWDWDIYTYIKLLNVPGGVNRISAYASSQNQYLSKDNIVELHCRKQFYYNQLVISGNVPLRRGVKRLVTELSQSNIKQWIVTTSSYKAVAALVQNIFNPSGLYFDGYITADDVTHLKPHPQAYLQAINESGCSRKSVVVIEDSKAGFSSANSAGLNSLITLSPWSVFDRSDFRNATAVVNHLGEHNYPCNVYQGASPKTRIVDLGYLNSLLSQCN